MKLSYKEENEDAKHQAEGLEESFQEIIKFIKEKSFKKAQAS